MAKSKFLKIDPNEWASIVLLPLASFKGASRTEVYRDSKTKF